VDEKWRCEAVGRCEAVLGSGKKLGRCGAVAYRGCVEQ